MCDASLGRPLGQLPGLPHVLLRLLLQDACAAAWAASGCVRCCRHAGMCAPQLAAGATHGSVLSRSALLGSSSRRMQGCGATLCHHGDSRRAAQAAVRLACGTGAWNGELARTCTGGGGGRLLALFAGLPLPPLPLLLAPAACPPPFQELRACMHAKSSKAGTGRRSACSHVPTHPLLPVKV